MSDERAKTSFELDYDDDPLAGHRGGGGCMTMVVVCLTLIVGLIILVL